MASDDAYRVAEWVERYEVNYRGHEAKPGDELQVKPLKYIRLKAHGHRQGAGFRRLKELAGKRAYEVFGIFCKFLEISGNQRREHRGQLLNERDKPATSKDLAFILDTTIEQTQYAIDVLSDLGWIIPPQTPPNITKHNRTELKESGDFRKIPENPLILPDSPEANRKPNVLWDAVCRIWGLNPVTKTEQKEVGRIVSDLKAKGATPEEIEIRLKRYREEWPEAADTARALVKHWDRFATDPKFRLRTGLKEQSADAAYAERMAAARERMGIKR